jgi:O-antigen/teichoic acid export membrane protein
MLTELQPGASPAAQLQSGEMPPSRSSDSVPQLSFQTEMGRVSRQSGIAFAGIIFTAILGYVFKVYLARVLGAENLGLYALGMTLVGFFGIVNGLGLPDAAMRFVAQYTAAGKFDALRALLWRGAPILLVSNLVFCAVLLIAGRWIAAQVYHAPQLIPYLPLFAAIMIAGVLDSFFGKVLAGYKEVGRRTLFTRFISSPLTMLLTVLLIMLGGGLWGYLAAQILSALVVLGLLISMVWRLTPQAARLLNVRRIPLQKEVWSFSVAMLGVGMMEFLMSQTDRVALGFFRGAHEVGIYSVAAAVVAYETILLQSVNQIFAPMIADLHARGENILLGRMFQTLTKWMLGLTCPLAIVILVFAQPIMHIFGRDFTSGWPVLVVGTCGQLVNCGVGSVGYILLMSGNQNRLVQVQVVMALVMVGLCLWLVPLWGTWGAALAAAITNAASNLWMLFKVKSALRISPYNLSYLKLLPPVLLAFLSVFAMKLFPLRSESVRIISALMLSYGIFCGAAFLMGLDADDHLIADAVWIRLRGAFGPLMLDHKAGQK